MFKLSKFFSRLLVVPLLLALAGCNMVVLDPSGYIAVQQRDLIVLSTLLMLVIIIPVILFTLFFAWKYRQSNTSATYDPEWHHSTRLELVIWLAPLAIIMVLGTVTWIATHQLDPYRQLSRINASEAVAPDTKPLTVEVVALDWKWLFIYPDLGIATVNELAAPVNVPLDFRITSAAVMNSFFVPALAGQIYAMAGMQTRLHAVINKPGEYEGFSANYSGAGFSNMRFTFHGLEQAGFDQWVEKVKSQSNPLSRDVYLELEKPSEREPVHHFSSVDPDLYSAILNMCAAPGKMCMNEMMHIDMSGGGGTESQENRERLQYDNRHADHYEAGHFGSGEPAATPAAAKPAGTEAQEGGGGHDMQNMNMHDGHSMPGMGGGSESAPAQPNDSN
ncbi:ubiquinol oxidase subunit II [Rhizobium sp. BK251]|uniref:ubiquinol oxidase subunit II n=1 Tax=Rhizobium sp. BK251 TaxID=2512125 RepID=UPI001050B28A|nr:ubiquinol oxidase subunit II [Rhizobium sp. BK251]TCL69846.1 cytochrome bo3 quinol oxidase subunit 2 [Rhizobium sp. BK251]